MLSGTLITTFVQVCPLIRYSLDIIGFNEVLLKTLFRVLSPRNAAKPLTLFFGDGAE